ncbi:uncharacterized protein Pyn_36331 [Prunus yedoensis var. nudiflora]|uniref:Uncharacterized protein n=1 Tax=Prunus yedoensis var. nudiflora TaxID=2094558 RepID=A0A314ZWD2_PRUYE|nr:uncharacterized protein Pyn_36331 [Prunus yedoensis var. nudiflora]
MANAENFWEFMSIGLLDSAQLDERQVRLAMVKEMIGRYAKAGMRMSEGGMLDQGLVEIKQQTQLAMALLKETELTVQKENEELAQVEAQIAKLQTRQDHILECRNQAVPTGAELKSSAKQLLKMTAEKKKALAERKLIKTS